MNKIFTAAPRPQYPFRPERKLKMLKVENTIFLHALRSLFWPVILLHDSITNNNDTGFKDVILALPGTLTWLAMYFCWAQQAIPAILTGVLVVLCTIAQPK